ncbi:MAG: FAD:protein FMN transferase, partial [Anaerolinea sp.]|nr:FAD:protein FMN transferase [Anaerolinea sp.]
PRSTADALDEIVSITVVGPDVLEADRFATAAFAMGRMGIYLIESLPDFEGYMIDRNGQATFTSNFRALTV